jgi:type IV pilus assembly protein PilO
MNRSLNDKKSVVVLMGIIALLLLAAFYYYAIYPKSETKKQTIDSIEQLTSETTQLQHQVAVLGVVETDHTNDFELRKKLPANRELDTLLHKIHEIELMSDAKIVAITFNNYDEEVAKSQIGKPADETTTEEDRKAAESEQTENGESTEEVDETKPVTPIDIESLPEQLKLISLNVEIMVLDYDHLLRFLSEIEEVERIVRIDSVEFLQPGEVELAQKNPDERISVTVQLTTFYSEEVVD